MELIKETPKVGDRVKGEYNEMSYTGTVIFNDKQKNEIEILRDDGETGGGTEYNGKTLWRANVVNGQWHGTPFRGKLYNLRIDNWRKRLK